MLEADVVNIEGEKVGTISLSEQVFGIEPNKDVVFRYITMQMTNKRAGTVSTKSRSTIKGSGRKPWRQKGTGRARAGTSRSPLWRHGAVIFGPKPREFHKSLNKKMKRLAIRSVLSDKIKEGSMIILNEFKIEDHKTKSFKKVLSNLSVETSALLVLPRKDEDSKKLKLASRNIENVKVIIADNPNNGKDTNRKYTRIDGLNCYDLLKHEKLIMTKDMIEKLEEVLKNG
ncbi:MAG: 50S ribosomal protein L4 [Thermotogae bacterium]|nr:50S ribosomal protein L4 [Thermotogota bacterium]